MVVKAGGMMQLFDKYKDVYAAEDSFGGYKAMNKSQLRKTAYNKVEAGFWGANVQKRGKSFLGRGVLWLRDHLFKSCDFGASKREHGQDKATRKAASNEERLTQYQTFADDILNAITNRYPHSDGSAGEADYGNLKKAHKIAVETKIPLRSKLVYESLKQLADDAYKNGYSDEIPFLAQQVFLANKKF